ncbi:MAG: hypothetical protein AVDCRST_MAG66-1106, partial [uncultured Pseudonocardia sp.]
CLAMLQQFFRGRSAHSPRRNLRARRRIATRANRPPGRSRTMSVSACQRSDPTLWPTATAWSSEVDTTDEDHAVSVPRPGPSSWRYG